MSRTTPKPKSELAKSIGARLRVEREAQGMTLDTLARGAGLSINTLRWHEAGSRMLRADELAGVASLLNIDPQAMMVPHDANREPDALIRFALGRRMQAERSLAAKRQWDAVKGTGIAVHELGAHEAGTRSLRIDQLIAIAGNLKCDPTKLITLEGNDPINA